MKTKTKKKSKPANYVIASPEEAAAAEAKLAAKLVSRGKYGDLTQRILALKPQESLAIRGAPGVASSTLQNSLWSRMHRAGQTDFRISLIDKSLILVTRLPAVDAEAIQA